MTHFQQWDTDKYANLGTFILSNYVQALDILDHDTAALEDSKQQYNITDEVMDKWEEEQTTYFADLDKELELTTLRAEYVELLEALQAADAEKSSAESSYYGVLQGI